MNAHRVLARLPTPLKLAIAMLLGSFALSHASAALMIRELSSGSETAAEHFQYKSRTALLRMVHQHTFGHGLMYGLTGAVFAFSGLRAWLIELIIIAAFLGSGLDQASWFLLKYGSDKMEYLSIFSGLLFSFAFASMVIVIFWRMFLEELYFRP